MTRIQIDNLVKFTILFRKELKDTYLMESDIDYIYDKYLSIIGAPISHGNEEEDWWQSVVIKNFEALVIKTSWMLRWNKNVKKGSKLNREKEKVLNYLCVINTIEGLRINKMLEMFRLYIGDPELISDEPYNHIHPINLKLIEGYIKSNLRDINLIMLEQ